MNRIEEDYEFYKDLDKVYKNPSRLMSRKIKIVKSDLNGGDRLLDIGCGTGEALLTVKDKYNELFGIDPNPNAVKFARERLSNIGHIKITQSSAYNLGFEDGMFDGVLFLDVLEHLSEPERAISEAKRVLRGGGQLIVTVPNGFNVFSRFKKDTHHVNFHTPFGWVRLLRRHGFKVDKVRAVKFPLIDADALANGLYMFGMCIYINGKKG